MLALRGDLFAVGGLLDVDGKLLVGSSRSGRSVLCVASTRLRSPSPRHVLCMFRASKRGCHDGLLGSQLACGWSSDKGVHWAVASGRRGAHPQSLKPDEELSNAKMTLTSMAETTDVRVEGGNAREYSSLGSCRHQPLTKHGRTSRMRQLWLGSKRWSVMRRSVRRWVPPAFHARRCTCQNHRDLETPHRHK